MKKRKIGMIMGIWTISLLLIPLLVGIAFCSPVSVGSFYWYDSNKYTWFVVPSSPDPESFSQYGYDLKYRCPKHSFYSPHRNFRYGYQKFKEMGNRTKNILYPLQIDW